MPSVETLDVLIVHSLCNRGSIVQQMLSAGTFAMQSAVAQTETAEEVLGSDPAEVQSDVLPEEVLMEVQALQS